MAGLEVFSGEGEGEAEREGEALAGLEVFSGEGEGEAEGEGALAGLGGEEWLPLSGEGEGSGAEEETLATVVRGEEAPGGSRDCAFGCSSCEEDCAGCSPVAASRTVSSLVLSAIWKGKKANDHKTA